MTIYQNTFDGTDGAAATISSLGSSGDAPSLVSKAGAATWTYAVIGKYSGATGLRFLDPGAATDKGYTRFTIAATAQMRGRVYFTLNSLPSTAQNLVVILDTAAAQQFAFGLLGGNVLRAVNAAGASLGSSSPALTAETRYRLEWQWKVGTTTTDGQLAAQLYVGASTTALWTYSATNVNVGTVNSMYVWLGDNNSTHPSDFTYDNFYLDDAAQTPAVGAYSGPVTATLTAGPIVSNAGGFTKLGTAVDTAAGLADSDDTTGIQSPTAPVNAVTFLELPGLLAAGAPSFTVRASKLDTSTTGTLKAQLCYPDGTAAAAEQTFTLTTAAADYTYSLTTAEANALTTRANLQLKVTANA